MHERPHLKTLKTRISESRKFIQVIAGPRQVGKTTLVTQLMHNLSIPYIYDSADAINPGNFEWLNQIWESARIKIKINKASEGLLIVDEIQKIENWSEVVKRNWDNDTRKNINLKVILLGSSRLLIQKGLTESLTGRFEIIYVNHWPFAEMQAAFNWSLDKFIYFGSYPGTADLIGDEKRWKNYVKDALIETSISKDILMLSRVDKPALLKRLFEIGSLYSGQIISFNKILGELQDAGNTTTLSHYLRLLHQAGLLGGIEKYTGKQFKSRASIPKFQVFNNALLTAQSDQFFKEINLSPIQWGRLVESAVGTHLINHAINERFHLFYWREQNNEVDFILESAGKTIAIEVKSGNRRPSGGMQAFAKKHHPQKTLLVGPAGISIEEFLSFDPSELF
jgi:uncharacterized protein